MPDLEDVRSAIDAFLDQLEELERERRRNRRLEDQLTAARRELQQLRAQPVQLEETRRELRNLHSQFTTVQQELHRVTLDRAEIHAQLTTTTRQRDSAAEDAARAARLELHQLQRRFETLRGNNETLAGEVTRLRAQLAVAEQRARQFERVMLDHAART